MTLTLIVDADGVVRGPMEKAHRGPNLRDPTSESAGAAPIAGSPPGEPAAEPVAAPSDAGAGTTNGTGLQWNSLDERGRHAQENEWPDSDADEDDEWFAYNSDVDWTEHDDWYQWAVNSLTGRGPYQIIHPGPVAMEIASAASCGPFRPGGPSDAGSAQFQ